MAYSCTVFLLQQFSDSFGCRSNERMKKYKSVKLLFFLSMFMLLKSQTNAIKYVFSFIPRQSNSEFGSSMLFTIVFPPLINGKSVAHLFQTIIR